MSLFLLYFVFFVSRVVQWLRDDVDDDENYRRSK